MDCDQNYHSLPHSLPPFRFITKFKIPLFHRNFWNRHVSLFQMFFCCNFEDSWKTFPLFFELPGGKVGSKVYRHWVAGSPPTNQGKWKAKRKQQLHVLVMGSLETRSHGMGSSWAQFTSFGSCQEFYLCHQLRQWEIREKSTALFGRIERVRDVFPYQNGLFFWKFLKRRWGPRRPSRGSSSCLAENVYWKSSKSGGESNCSCWS